MTIYDFMNNSPWLTFFLASVIAGGIKFSFELIINRPLRHMSIRKHGWPPEHCDADGDLRVENSEDEQ